MNDIDRLEQEIQRLRERVQALENAGEKKLIERHMYPGNFNELVRLRFKDLDEDKLLMRTAKDQRGNTVIRILERF